ncbi:hypothetical protein [Mucilaginibacter sp. FT3.2]|uniref:hypothetical protein n=1 Tax=Mucilaginibacter sp. FT3.2 TaxID=2723090 RepID=UPI001619B857|nr:hypothetical protein [Mucilaginibacter sp. FT3.2]MBB6233396.1 hypothetical protein [Mucilaginibacter sp. FT3.2]
MLFIKFGFEVLGVSERFGLCQVLTIKCNFKGVFVFFEYALPSTAIKLTPVLQKACRRLSV